MGHTIPHLVNRVSVWVMVFNATFNNISVISWQSVLLMEETGVCWENHQPAASRWQTLSHIYMLYRVHLAWAEFELTTLVVIGTNSMGSCKSNYHTNTTMTGPYFVNSCSIHTQMENLSMSMEIFNIHLTQNNVIYIFLFLISLILKKVITSSV